MAPGRVEVLSGTSRKDARLLSSAGWRAGRSRPRGCAPLRQAGGPQQPPTVKQSSAAPPRPHTFPATTDVWSSATLPVA